MSDSNGLRLVIKKRPISERLAWYILITPFFLAFLLEFLKLPGILKYTIDVAWISALFLILFNKRVAIKRNISGLFALILILFLYTLVAYIFNFQSIFYYLWGFRNNFRFYVALIAFVLFLQDEDVVSYFKILDVFFGINAVVTCFQFFVLKYSQDYLGGIFGVDTGCNAYSLIFYGLVVSRSLLLFMSGKEKTLTCFVKCGTAIILSALAELKFFFVVFVAILGLAAVFTRFSWRKLIVILLSAFMIMIAGNVLTGLFGVSSNITIERIIELVTATNYATSKDLGRFTAIPTIAETILTTQPEQLFGMGLGNCDTSAFAICNTPFYQNYSSLHYTWFSSAFLFLEVGYIGLLIHISVFVTVFIAARKRLKNGVGDPLCCQIGLIFSVLCIGLTFYNSSLRMEAGYIAYFALALPFIRRNVEGIHCSY